MSENTFAIICLQIIGTIYGRAVVREEVSCMECANTEKTNSSWTRGLGKGMGPRWFRSVFTSTSLPKHFSPRFYFDLTSASLRFQLGTSIAPRPHIDSTLVSLWFHFGLTLSSSRYHLHITSISLNVNFGFASKSFRTRFNITSKSLRSLPHYFEFTCTSVSLRLNLDATLPQVGFTSMSLRFHVDATSISPRFHFGFTSNPL